MVPAMVVKSRVLIKLWDVLKFRNFTQVIAIPDDIYIQVEYFELPMKSSDDAISNWHQLAGFRLQSSDVSYTAKQTACGIHSDPASMMILFTG